MGVNRRRHKKKQHDRGELHPEIKDMERGEILILSAVMKTLKDKVPGIDRLSADDAEMIENASDKELASACLHLIDANMITLWKREGAESIKVEIHPPSQWRFED
jgi:hypothetical protein